MPTVDLPVRLTRFSHGAGCGCKIAPDVLDEILAAGDPGPDDARLIVGNDARDDAAVYDLGDGRGLVSTTDFFMPIVDDPHIFGRIAAANALSDVYAMGGMPVVAIAVLGWPLDRLPARVAARVVEGGRAACREAGIALAGGHSIDSPEPIFGLAASGLVDLAHLKRNTTACAGDLLLLTKPLGVGILTTAEKQGRLRAEDRGRAAHLMTRLNRVGPALARLDGVHAMTDVTGFGLVGHLVEVCAGSGVRARVHYDAVPVLDGLGAYLDAGCTPGGTARNWRAYGHRVGPLDERRRDVLCDPQTSGGLLVAVAPAALDAARGVLADHGLTAHATPLGRLLPPDADAPLIEVDGSDDES